MPIELRELIIQARIDPSDPADTRQAPPKLTPEEREEIIKTALERIEERLASAHQR